MRGIKEAVFLFVMLIPTMASFNEDLENIVKNTTQEMKNMKMDMVNMRMETKEHLALTKDLMRTIEAKEASIQEFERDMSFLKEPSRTFVSCYSGYTNSRSDTISCGSLLYSYINIDGAGPDLDTGMFSSGYPATYTAAWSLTASSDAGEEAVSIFQRKNGKTVDGPIHFPDYKWKS